MLIKTKNGMFRLEKVYNAAGVDSAVEDLFDGAGLGNDFMWVAYFSRAYEENLKKAKKNKEEALRKGEDKNKINKTLQDILSKNDADFKNERDKFLARLKKVVLTEEKAAETFDSEQAPSGDASVSKKQEAEEKNAKDIFDEAIIDIEQRYASRKAEEKKNYEKRLAEIRKKYEAEQKKLQDTKKALKKAFLDKVARKKLEYSDLFNELVQDQAYKLHSQSIKKMMM